MLNKVIESKHFCKLDNSLTGSIRDIAKTLKVSKSTLARELSGLQQQDLLRKVQDIFGNNVLMLSLDEHCTMYPVEQHFHRVMYELKSHELAEDFVTAEREQGMFINPETGELLGRINKNWYDILDIHKNNPAFGKFGTRNVKSNVTSVNKTTSQLTYVTDRTDKARRMRLAMNYIDTLNVGQSKIAV